MTTELATGVGGTEEHRLALTDSSATVLSVASILAESAYRRGDKIALIEDDRQHTFAETWEQARRYAAGLQARGVRPGDRVALLAPNVAEFVFAYYGIFAAGGVVVPVPTLLTPGEAGHLVGDSGAMLVISHASFGETGAAVAQASGVPHTDLAELADHEPLARMVPSRPMDVAVIFYTSGTTGRPKGALLSHLNMVMNATVNAFDVGRTMEPDEVVLACLPLFHVFGQTSVLNSSFRKGSTLVLQPRWDAARAIELMAEHDVTLFCGVPTMFVGLVDAARDAPRLPKLRHAGSGGASLPVALLRRFEEIFSAEIHEGYGLSETASGASANQATFGTRPGSVGHGMWGVETAIADPADRARIRLLEPGETGEIVVRGHNVFGGYLDSENLDGAAATAAAVVDGWFRTGDLGHADADGFVHIVDRLKDLIIRSGFNVYPREVEEVLMGHPDVGQVAVIGLPDDRVGEEVCAVVVPATGRRIDPEELGAWARDRLARHKFPRRIEVVDALPTGPSHKVLKRELRARLARPGNDEKVSN
ncbi:long-chain-fatty-acid--CoA ligase [Naumannella huperziae]